MNTYYWIALGLFLNMFVFDRIPVLKYLLTPIAGLTLGVISFPLGFFGMFVLAPLIKWDDKPSLGSYPTDLTIKHNFIIRGDLPAGVPRWWQPPDERWPGPMYEPEMERVYLKYGRVIASWYNGAIRNQMMGLAAVLGKPTTDYAPEVTSGFWQRGDVWVLTIPFIFVKFVFGWQIYRRLDDTFLAVPVGTIKRK